MIREAKPEETFEVANFMKKFEKATAFVQVDPVHSGKKYEELIRNNMGKMFILEKETGEMIGGLGCVIGEDLHYPRMLAVETYWFVAEEYRGRGLELLDHFESWAEKNNYIPAIVHLVDSYPERLKNLYIKRGYKLVEQHFIKEI